MMFERSFSWTMRNGSRLLFAGSVLMLLAGIARIATILSSSYYYFATAEHIVRTAMSPTAWLLVCAMVADSVRKRESEGTL